MKKTLKKVYLAMFLDFVVLGISLCTLPHVSVLMGLLLCAIAVFEIIDIYNALQYVKALKKAIKADEFIKQLMEEDEE